MERTLALIKPDAVGQPWVERVFTKNDEDEVIETDEVRSPDKSVDIIARIRAAGFNIVSQKTTRLSRERAAAFYAEHEGKPFFDDLCTFMSSGLIVALVLEKEDAIASWRSCMGATNSLVAKEEAEAAHPLNEELWSIRASFGTDGQRNAVHGSDSGFSAARELEFFFPAHQRYERTLALIKPDVVGEGKEDAVIATIAAHGFNIIARTTETLSRERAAAFYAEHEGKPFFDNLVSFMSSGATTALLLERRNAIRYWRALAGPTDTAMAREKVPNSVRAQYGTDGTRNAVHGSDSAAAVKRESAFWFPEALPVERTLALIKPGTADKHADAIRTEIEATGFKVLSARRVRVSREFAEEFYAEHRGKPFFDALTSYMSSAAVIAMVLAKPAAIKCWRALLGPTNIAVARVEAPNSLRARFGVDGTRNACHGSDSQASSDREISLFFPEMLPAGQLSGTQGVEYIKEKEVATVFSTAGPVTKSLSSVVVEGLTALCKSRPPGLDAVQWLGEWLLQNNPRQGRVSDEPVVGIEGVQQDVGGIFQAGAGAGAGAGSLTITELETKQPDTAAGSGSGAGGAVSLPPGAAIVFLLGGPGSGRASVATKVAATFNYEHLSVGTLLRSEVDSGSTLGRDIKVILDAGSLVGDEIVLGALKAAINRSSSSRFLIDGFPRTLDQAVAFEQSVGQPNFVVSLEAPDGVLQANINDRPSRSDDAAFAARLEAHKTSTVGVIDFYSKLGLVRRLNVAQDDAHVYSDATHLFEPEVVFVLGGPAGGKGTQCAALAEKFGYTHLDTGSLLRAEAASGSAEGDDLAKIMANGDLVPLAVTLRIVRRAIEARPNGRFLLDGFPRTLEQAQAFSEQVCNAKYILEMAVPEAVSRARLAKVLNRADSGADAIARRLRIHRNSTQPLIEAFRKAGAVRTVDAGASTEAVFEACCKAIAPEIVFVLGGPGSGKGTQCARIAAEFGYTHLSAGDLLRAEVLRGSADGAMIDGMMAQGQIVPVRVTLALLKRAIETCGNDRFLIDGFPRAADQAPAFESTIAACTAVLYYDCDEDAMRERIMERGRTSGRVDDNADAITKRFATFRHTSLPVVHSYAAQGKVLRIDAGGSVDAVYSASRAAIAPEVVFVVGGPGSGKGTQCAKLVQEFGYTHLSSGDLLRAEVTRGGALGQSIEKIMAAGELVSVDLTLSLLRQAMRASGSSKFLVDGFPRTLEQLETYEAQVGCFSSVLYLDVPQDIMRQRLLKRGLTSGRVDDNAASIEQRLVTFSEATMPLVEACQKRGVLRTASSVGSIDEVYARVRAHYLPTIVLLAGASGSGRGELAQRAGLQLGYHRIGVTALLRAEAASGSVDGAAIKKSIAAGRTAPVDATLRVIKKAILASRASKFLLDGYPRVVSDGFPGVHDQLFALEAMFGTVKSMISLEASSATRKSRVGGDASAVDAAADAFLREKRPVAQFMAQLGKAVVIDTESASPDEVFAQALSALE